MNVRRFFLFCFIVLFILGICINSELVYETFASSMQQYLYRLLPVLFPYMVIARLMISQDLLAPVSLFLPMHKIFRLPASVMPVFCLGNLCGFPVGAQLTGILWKEGKISKEEAERLCAISGNVSPAFVIQIVGSFFWNNTVFGVFLLCVQFLSCCLCGFFLSKNTVNTGEKYCTKKITVLPNFSVSFCQAITESAAGCVSLCGYIIFFSVLLAVLPMQGVLRVPIAAILEFTAGVEEASRVGYLSGLFFTGFSVGFGGLCVLAQISCVLGDSGISLRKYSLGKCIQGVVCGLACTAYGICFPMSFTDNRIHSTLSQFDILPDGIGKWILPLTVIVLAVIHYSLHLRVKSVKTDDSSSDCW